MREEKFVVVCYDISDNKRRNRVANVLEDYGVRVQYSVFECLLTEELLKMLKVRLASEIEEEQDKVFYYHLCERCAKQIETIGGAEKEDHKEIECYVV